MYADFRLTFCMKTYTYTMMETNLIDQDVMKMTDYYL